MLADSDHISPAMIASYYEVRARVALLNKDFKTAERIYLENVNVYFLTNNQKLFYTLYNIKNYL